MYICSFSVYSLASPECLREAPFEKILLSQVNQGKRCSSDYQHCNGGRKSSQMGREWRWQHRRSKDPNQGRGKGGRGPLRFPSPEGRFWDKWRHTGMPQKWGLWSAICSKGQQPPVRRGRGCPPSRKHGNRVVGGVEAPSLWKSQQPILGLGSRKHQKRFLGQALSPHNVKRGKREVWGKQLRIYRDMGTRNLVFCM